MLSAFRQYLFHPILFPEIALTDELDLNSRFRRHSLGVLSNPVPERLGELWIIENPDPPLKQERCHSTGKADPRQRAENQHPVPTTQHAFNLCGVSLS